MKISLEEVYWSGDWWQKFIFNIGILILFSALSSLFYISDKGDITFVVGYIQLSLWSYSFIFSLIVIRHIRKNFKKYFRFVETYIIVIVLIVSFFIDKIINTNSLDIILYTAIILPLVISAVRLIAIILGNQDKKLTSNWTVGLLVLSLAVTVVSILSHNIFDTFNATVTTNTIPITFLSFSIILLTYALEYKNKN